MILNENLAIMTQITTKLVRSSYGNWILRPAEDSTDNGISTEWPVEGDTSIPSRLTKANIETLVIDLSSTDYVDSQGLKILFDAHRQFTPRGTRIILKNPNTLLQKLFKTMQFNRLFTIEID